MFCYLSNGELISRSYATPCQIELCGGVENILFHKIHHNHRITKCNAFGPSVLHTSLNDTIQVYQNDILSSSLPPCKEHFFLVKICCELV